MLVQLGLFCSLLERTIQRRSRTCLKILRLQPRSPSVLSALEPHLRSIRALKRTMGGLQSNNPRSGGDTKGSALSELVQEVQRENGTSLHDGRAFFGSQIRFHTLRGRNIELSEEDRYAVRTRSFKHGLLFSSRPLRPYELFEIEIVELERVWAGSIRLGLTTFDPDSVNETLPPYAIPNLTQQPGCFVLAGSAMHGVPMGASPDLPWGNEGYPLNLDDTAVVCDGCKIGVAFDLQGRMYFTLNGEVQGMAQEGLPIDGNIYAIVDVYGQAKAIRIADSKC